MQQKQKKPKRGRKAAAPAAPARLTMVQTVAGITKQVSAIETNMAQLRVTFLGEMTEGAALETGAPSVDNSLAGILTRLELLAREGRRINNRIGQ